jgi:hypothetical protein
MTTLHPGQCLHPAQALASQNKLYRLIMQADGNVVLYDHQSHPIWTTNTKGCTPREFAMQTDGNLVLYSTDNKPRWASGTHNNPGAFLNVQDDGNLVIYREGSRAETPNNALWDRSGKNKPGSPVTPSAPDNQIRQYLDEHNKYRAEVGVPPLQWSDSLATSAQQWAHHLAATDQYCHDPNPGVGIGENLELQNFDQNSPPKFIEAWGREKSNYNDGTIPNCSKTGNFEEVGHYTQLVWRETTHVGCGFAPTANGNYILVCRYSPAGNIVGLHPYKPPRR